MKLIVKESLPSGAHRSAHLSTMLYGSIWLAASLPCRSSRLLALFWVKGHALFHILLTTTLSFRLCPGPKAHRERGTSCILTQVHLTLKPMLYPCIRLPSAVGPWTSCWTSLSLGLLLCRARITVSPPSQRGLNVPGTQRLLFPTTSRDTISRPLPTMSPSSGRASAGHRAVRRRPSTEHAQ